MASVQPSSASQQDGTYAITGIARPSDVVVKTKTIPYAQNLPVRREISTLYRTPTTHDEIWDPEDKRQWTLLCYALESFKALPVNEKLSYFQVAGIHGYPETDWDGAPSPPKDPPVGTTPATGANPFGGYCEHNTIAFPTWHRPYMLLFEQRLWELMKTQIENWSYPRQDKDAWIKSASNFRLPYWDWARAQSYNKKFAVPEVLTLTEVIVEPPDQGRKTMLNPFWEFENPQKDASGEPLPFGTMPKGMEKWNVENSYVNRSEKDPTKRETVPNRIPWNLTARTGRYGVFLNQKRTRYIGLEGINNFTGADTQLQDTPWYSKNPGTLADAVNRLSSADYTPNWGTFASTKWNNEQPQKATEWLSLEYIHNVVHNVTGGVSYKEGMGHMSDVPVAAFDPTFWLHHCNIDRLTAMWQALHWDSWFDTQEPGAGNIPDKKEDDPLQPFHTKANGDPVNDVWTSKMTRDWTKLSYSYDTLEPSKGVLDSDGTLDEEKYKDELRAKINALYPSTGQFVNRVFKSSKLKTPNGVDAVKGKEADKKLDRWNDFLINVVYDRYALGGSSYSIIFYLGGNKNDPYTVCSSKCLVGRVYTFSAGGQTATDGGCANCAAQQKAGVLSRAQIPVTIKLLQDVLDEERDVWSMESDKVQKYLEDNLHWKFVAYGGEELKASEFPNTQIKVYWGHGKPEEASVPGKNAKDLPLMQHFDDEYRLLYTPLEGNLEASNTA